MILATFYGEPVEVREAPTINGQVEYSTDGSSWSTTISQRLINETWYARFVTVTGTDFSGDVKITWILQKLVDTTWTDTTDEVVTTLFTLTGASGQTIYATENGLVSDNEDWGQYCTEPADYRIKVVFEKV